MTTITPIPPEDMGEVYKHHCGSTSFIFSVSGKVMCAVCHLVEPDLKVTATNVVPKDDKHS